MSEFLTISKTEKVIVLTYKMVYSLYVLWSTFLLFKLSKNSDFCGPKVTVVSAYYEADLPVISSSRESVSKDTGSSLCRDRSPSEGPQRMLGHGDALRAARPGLGRATHSSGEAKDLMTGLLLGRQRPPVTATRVQFAALLYWQPSALI